MNRQAPIARHFACEHIGGNHPIELSDKARRTQECSLASLQSTCVHVSRNAQRLQRGFGFFIGSSSASSKGEEKRERGNYTMAGSKGNPLPSLPLDCSCTRLYVLCLSRRPRRGPLSASSTLSCLQSVDDSRENDHDHEHDCQLLVHIACARGL